MIRQISSFREEYIKKQKESIANAPEAKYLAEREEARQKAVEAAKRPAQPMKVLVFLQFSRDFDNLSKQFLYH